MYIYSRAGTRVVYCIVTADDGHSYTNLFLHKSCFHIKKVNKLTWRKSIIRQYFYSMVQCLHIQWFVCTRADMLINSFKTYGPEDHVHWSTDVRPVQWMTVLAGFSGEKKFVVLDMRKTSVNIHYTMFWGKKIYISNVRHLDVCDKVFQTICNGYFFSLLIILIDRCVLVSDLIMTWANFLTTINTEINIKQSIAASRRGPHP